MNDTTVPSRSRYPSDLSDQQWERVTALLPAARVTGRPRSHSLRDVLDAINYRWETGCAWRMLPHDFPPWGTVYTWFRVWQRRGTLRQIRESLLKPYRRTLSRNIAGSGADQRLSPDRPSPSSSK